MTRYDNAQFEPPAPIAQVSLRNPDTRSTISDVPMLLDTGADVSLVPAATLESLKLAASEDILYELLSFDGKISFAPVVQLELVFCNRIFRGQYLVIDRECGILSRNVINAVSLIFDGPNLTWKEKRNG
jgi:hypothetical protein